MHDRIINMLLMSKIQDILNISDLDAENVMRLIKIKKDVTWEDYSEKSSGIAWQEEIAPSMDGTPQNLLTELLGKRKVALLFNLLMTLANHQQNHKNIFPAPRNWYEESRETYEDDDIDMFTHLLDDDICSTYSLFNPYQKHSQYTDLSMLNFISKDLKINNCVAERIMAIILLPKSISWHDFRFEEVGEKWQVTQKNTQEDDFISKFSEMIHRNLVSLEQIQKLYNLLVRDQFGARYPRFCPRLHDKAPVVTKIQK